MVIPNVGSFFDVSAGAAATLIGFLSVANSIIGQDGDSETRLYRSILAESAYGSLADIFFVALAALVPALELGPVVVMMALVGLLTLRQLLGKGLRNLKALHSARAQVSGSLLVISAAVYLAQLVLGVWMMLKPGDGALAFWLVYIILALYAIGLARAWELLGIREMLRKG